jgi:hypothetical protein
VKAQTMRPSYVEFMPKDLQDGVLYISKRFKTASHRCCCGCGTKIVTPLRPTEYELIERGGGVSLEPSIGNWDHPCRSHYWIRDNRVVWARPMSRAHIEAGRAYDDALKQTYFSRTSARWWRQAWDRLMGWLED